MRELPILACDSVAKALWEGKQTQHRVPMKPQPSDGWVPYSYGEVHKLDKEGHFVMRNGEPVVFGWGASNFEGDDAYKAPWNVGDVIYVREACRFTKNPNGAYCVRFRADDALIRTDELPYESTDIAKWIKFQFRYSWTGNQNMLKAVARTRLLVKRVWCERIQDISEEDAKAEGVEYYCPFGICGGDGYIPQAHTVNEPYDCKCASMDYIECFRDLWISIYDKESWNSNQWVWACEFEKLPG